MGKIKLNLVSGAVVEKPLINAFKANNNSYIVLDNEMNGSMGLPIILVCKFENNKLTKILDQNEWGIVKEYLKNIIAGNQIEFIKVDNEIAADDIYYTQLTLPVPSFDALKNAYKIGDNESTEVGIMDTSIPQAPVDNPVNINPVVEPVNTQVEEPVASPVIEPVVNPVQDIVPQNIVAPETSAPVMNSAPVIDMPVSPQMENTVISPSINNEEINPINTSEIVQSVSPVMEASVMNPVMEPQAGPVLEQTSPQNVEVRVEQVQEESIFKEQKEAFMQACENMFDALVQKFERELENRK